jgi:hypothetical protein
MNIRVFFFSFSSIGPLLLPAPTQYLAGIPGAEQVKQDQQPSNLADCTHVDWETLAQDPLLILSCARLPASGDVRMRRLR